MKHRSLLRAALRLVVVLGAIEASAADRATLPTLASLGEEAFTATEKQALTDWALAQPEVSQRLEGSRWRVLKIGSDMPKDETGTYRRANLYIRNYTKRVIHQIRIHLGTAALDIRDVQRAGQPSPEEIEEALSIIRADGRLAELNENETLSLQGGFYVPSEHREDPCYQDLCMQFGFMKPGFELKPERMVMVNLTLQRVVHLSYNSGSDADNPNRMTQAEENR